MELQTAFYEMLVVSLINPGCVLLKSNEVVEYTGWIATDPQISFKYKPN
jgi:hypothetical protein